MPASTASRCACVFILSPMIKTIKLLRHWVRFDAYPLEALPQPDRCRARDQRQLPPVETVLLDRSLPLECPGLDTGPPLAQPRLVDEDDGAAFGAAIFLALASAASSKGG